MSIAINSIKEQNLNLLNKNLINKNISAREKQKQTNNPFINIGNISINNTEKNKQNLQEVANYIAKTENLLTNKADLNISEEDDSNKSFIGTVAYKQPMIIFTPAMHKSIIKTIVSKLGKLFFSK